jgi:hypothetical protein
MKMTIKHFVLTAALALIFPALSAAFSTVAAHAETCIKVDEDNSPKATLSGRIVAHHQIPSSWKREGIHAPGEPFLSIDAPLLVDYGTGCQRLFDIALFVAGKPPRAGQHVTIAGTLNRFDSATVNPSIYLDARSSPERSICEGSLAKRQQSGVTIFGAAETGRPNTEEGSM